MQHRGRPAHQATVGVAHQRRLRMPERPDQARGVAGQRPPVVAAGRFVAAAVAAQIDGHRADTGQAPQLMAPRPPERTEPVQQDDQRTGGGRREGAGGWVGLDDVEADAVGVDVEVSPRPGDAGDRRVRSGRRPDVTAPTGRSRVSCRWRARSCRRSWLGPGRDPVNAERVSLTVSMVCCGPRIRRTLRQPSKPSTAAPSSMMTNTMRNAAHRQIQLSSSSARKKKKKNVEYSSTTPRQDEEDAAGHPLLDVAGDLRAGQLHLCAHQRRHLSGRVLDQFADRRVGGQGMRVDQRNRSHGRGYAVALTIAHGHDPPQWAEVVGLEETPRSWCHAAALRDERVAAGRAVAEGAAVVRLH